MSRSLILVLLGVLVALSPYVGIPYSYLMWVLPVLGLVVLLMGLSLKKGRVAETEAHEKNPST